MNFHNYNFEKILYGYVYHFKSLMSFLQEFYDLNDHPYNVAGKKFPKMGDVIINKQTITYHFHGKGCTIFQNNLEVFFNIDMSKNKDNIIISSGGWIVYLKSLLPEFNEIDKLIDLRSLLFEFENQNFLTRHGNNELSYFFVRDDWFENFESKLN